MPCYVPGLTVNLLSESMIIQRSGQVKFKKDSAIIIKDRQLIVKLWKHGNLYVLEQEPRASMYGSALAATTIEEKTEVWHNRLGHVSHSPPQTLIKSGGVEGLDELKADNIEQEPRAACEGCIYGKAHRNPFGDSIGTEYQAKEVLGRVHADLCGPINLNLEGDPMTLLYDAKYILMLVDEKSRMIS